MPLDFSEADAAKMRALQVELSLVLRRANDQHLEAAVAAFACIRCARALLDQYPDAARVSLITLVVAFLEHAPPPPDSILEKA
jgi:hypothetical protein